MCIASPRASKGKDRGDGQRAAGEVQPDASQAPGAGERANGRAPRRAVRLDPIERDVEAAYDAASFRKCRA
jgi:hypothetical protein